MSRRRDQTRDEALYAWWNSVKRKSDRPPPPAACFEAGFDAARRLFLDLGAQPRERQPFTHNADTLPGED